MVPTVNQFSTTSLVLASSAWPSTPLALLTPTLSSISTTTSTQVSCCQSHLSTDRYSSLHSIQSVNAKLTGLVNLVKSVNSGGTLIQGIGTQCHLGVSALLPFDRNLSLTKQPLIRPVVPEVFKPLSSMLLDPA
jgi:hypothetical protein